MPEIIGFFAVISSLLFGLIAGLLIHRRCRMSPLRLLVQIQMVKTGTVKMGGCQNGSFILMAQICFSVVASANTWILLFYKGNGNHKTEPR